MWDTIEPIQPKETYPFLQWMERFVMKEVYLRQARDTMYEFEAQISELANMHRTPQSPKHHAEGPVMTYHLERMLCALLAIADGKADLMQIQEFASELNLKEAIIELQDTISENAATLKAFIFVHDSAKYDCLTFDAPARSKGASEGFASPQKMSVKYLNDRYIKLLKAFEIQHPNLSPVDLCVAFGQEYQIKTSYKGHDKVASSAAYSDLREQVADICRLTTRDREMLYLLVKEHINEISYFSKKPDGVRYKVMEAIAQKAGMDSGDVLDLQLASLFLDAAVGSLAYHDGGFDPDVKVVINMLKSEELSGSLKNQARQSRLEDKKRKTFKSVLESCGLGSEDIFEILKTPFGAKRAEILAKVEDAVRYPEFALDNPELQKLYPQIQKARLLYQTKKR